MQLLECSLKSPARTVLQYASGTPLPREAYRLCIFCRTLEPTSEGCSYLRAAWPTSTLDLPATSKKDVSLSAADETLLTWLKTQPSVLCTRCRNYDPIKVFRLAEPPDTYEFSQDDGSFDAYLQELRCHALELGELRYLTLSASCQFCRLIYRILPSTPLPPSYRGLSIIPFRAHHRFPHWEQFPIQSRSRSAILLGLSFGGTVEEMITRRRYSSIDTGHFGNITGPAIALAVEDPALKRNRESGTRALATSRTKYNGQLVAPFMDFEAAKKQLHMCMKHHKACATTVPEQLSVIWLIDVSTATGGLVPYSRGCHYAALSYLWGVAVQKDKESQTIADSIIATRKLGLRYLWVS